MTISACQPIEDEIVALLQERAELQAELREATSAAEKASLGAQINHVNQQLGIKRAELTQCEIQQGVPQPITVAFSGTATLTTTNQQARGPYNQGLSASVTFNAARTTNSVDSLVPITVGPFSTPLGQNITTITMVGTTLGQFNKASGALTIQGLDLWFHQSVHLFSSGDEDSRVTFNLTTGTVSSSMGRLSGSALKPESGAITVVGASQFSGGALGGSDCTLVLDGTINPLP